MIKSSEMRTSLSVFSAAGLLFSFYIPVISAISLEQFQPIEGFSPACVNAYKTPLSGCTGSDFKSGSCSTDCIAFLEALTQVLTSECGDTSASPNTLIGSFFKKEGTSTLCPNVLGGSKASSGGEQGDKAISTLSTSQYPSSYTLGALETISAEPEEFTLSLSSTSTSAGDEATTTQLAIVRTTVSPEVSNEATTTHLAVVRTTVSPEISTSIRSSPSPSDATRTKASTTPASSDRETTYNGGGGGGGSPLDVGSSGSSSASHRYRIGAWVLGVMVGSIGLALLL